MEVHFDPDLEAKLSRLASHQGRAAETLVRGEFVEHHAIREWIDRRYPG
jgi:predicted transcriptional regulator